MTSGQAVCMLIGRCCITQVYGALSDRSGRTESVCVWGGGEFRDW